MSPGLVPVTLELAEFEMVIIVDPFVQTYNALV
jgi:hypothetical protein